MSDEPDKDYEKGGYLQLAKMIKSIEDSINTDENGEAYVDISDLLGAAPGSPDNRPKYYDLVSYINNEISQQPDAKRRIEQVRQADKSITPRPPGFGGVKINPKELVLPTLSIHDQISELERIGEAIEEGVLDETHKSIVMTEVYGLRDLTYRDNTAANGNDADISAIELRNRRLEEVIKRLERGG